MNPIVEENNDILMHYGTPRHSGRYPWGSGKDPYQRTRDLLGRVELLKKQGWTETPENIQKEFGLTTDQYRAQKGLARDLRRMDLVKRAESLKADGLNNSEIGRKMGIADTTVHSLLNSDSKARMMQSMNTADFIRDQLDEVLKKDPQGVIDIGAGVEHELNISREKMKQAVLILESEGYVVRGGRVDQVNNAGRKTTLKVIGPPDTPKNAAYNYEHIHSLNEYVSHDGGDTFKKFVYPESMDSKRLMIRYNEDGGIDKDGIVEIRRGVKDLSLGEAHYAQVRILVDNNKYIKGMAMYSDDMPDGVDVVFNTNKTKDVAKLDVLKDIKADPDNPFGSLIKAGGQSYYDDPNGKYFDPVTGKKQSLSLINKRADEGDWTEWKDKLPAQFLSKQSESLARKQLQLAIDDKKSEYDDICSLTNPTVKKHFLKEFSESCDAAAVNLQAAALPGQKYRVIIPINTLKETEVYAPMYENGSKLALVRYPHGGTFEIPILTVNNRHAKAKEILGKDIVDAVGINKDVADRLSGADFDGDTVMCIPTHNGRVKIVNSDKLKQLEGFDPKVSYGSEEVKVDGNGNKHYYRNGREYPIMRNTQNQMGVISNLITDMTLLGASEDELARAVRHSMVVIDAEKHKLDYKQSELDNNISALKKEWQTGGASTLISRSKGQYSVPRRQGNPITNVPGATMTVLSDGKRVKVDAYDPNKPLGSLIYKKADDADRTVAKIDRRSKNEPNGTVRISAKGRRYIQFDGSDEWTPLDGKSDTPAGTRVRATPVISTQMKKSTRMAETDNAHTLVSETNTAMERLYADYANTMKSMANQARLEHMDTGKIAYNSSAATTYKSEVKDLMEQLKKAELNRPKERQVNIRAKAEVEAKKEAYKQEHGTDMKPAEVKKIGQQAVSKYRDSVGAVARRDRSIIITDRGWDAIQAGAISETQLTKILNNADPDVLRERATPRTANTLSTHKINKIKQMRGTYTTAEIAAQLGVSPSTVSKYLKGVNYQ